MKLSSQKLVYYRPAEKTISFHLVAEAMIRALKQKGLSVMVRDIHFSPSWQPAAEDTGSIGIVHPLFYQAASSSHAQKLTFEETMTRLAAVHPKIFGCEVSDSSQISPQFVAWGNHPRIDGIVLPSQYSRDVFQESGVTTRLGVVPHGVKTVTASPLFQRLRQSQSPKVLLFMLHEAFRKGFDLSQEIFEKFPDTLFIVKGAARSSQLETTQVGNVLFIQGWLSPEDLASLYEESDFLLSPHRGGGFELNVLEALAYGLPVMVTNHGCVLDYVTPERGILLPVQRMEPMVNEAGGSIGHSGMGARIDVEASSLLIREALQNKREWKDRLQKEKMTIRYDYSWERVAERFMEFMEKAS